MSIRKIFKETVILGARLGMVNLGHIALDGTKIKANTSKHKAMSYGRMKQDEDRLEREIDELMLQAEAADAEKGEAFGKDNNGYNLPEELQRREERLEKILSIREELEREKREKQHINIGQTPIIEDKEQRSFADGDARMMLMKRGEFDYGYNAQACMEEHGVIVAGDLLLIKRTICKPQYYNQGLRVKLSEVGPNLIPSHHNRHEQQFRNFYLALLVFG